ncbi:MAG: DUF814 domain-containing protein [Deltaproteobacteria bacterium]|nr:DUF814 domain-containing protein [Deltaproteobacteria bacterium]
MSLSLAELDILVPELRESLVGQRVRKAYELGAGSAALDMGRMGYLVLSVEQGLSRLHLSPQIRKPGQCPSFCGLLRKHLAGAVVTGVALPRRDRIVQIDFHRGTRLMVEMLGRSGQLLLVDGENRVLGIHGQARRLSVGATYVAPESADAKLGAVRFSLEDLNGQVRAFYEAEEGARLLEARRREVRKSLQRTIKKLNRLMSRCNADMERSGDPETLHRYGDLILASLPRIPPKTSVAEVPDWFADGEQIRIPIDPARSAAQNANRYHRLATKATRTRQIAAERRASAEEQKGLLERGLSQLEIAQSLEAVDGLAVQLGVVGSVGQSKKRVRGGSERAPFRRFESRTGMTIFVGKTAQDNQELTFRVARGNDLWLHVSAGAGPHVVVRSRQDGSVDQSSLQDAAALALFFATKNRLATGEVLYTRCKHVRAVKGQPGRVIPGQTKTLYVRLDEQSLARLLSQRG